MGSIFSCGSDEDGLDKHERKRLEILQKGGRFGRKKMVALGVTFGSDPVVVRLIDDQSTVYWKCVDAPTFGSVKVTNLQSVKPAGAMGFSLFGKGHSKELELEAEHASIRDTWVVALSEVIVRSKETGKHAEAERLAQVQEESARKAAYWATRRKELEDVEAAAAERKKKYADAGMRFTAEALSSSDDTRLQSS